MAQRPIRRRAPGPQRRLRPAAPTPPLRLGAVPLVVDAPEREPYRVAPTAAHARRPPPAAPAPPRLRSRSRHDDPSPRRRRRVRIAPSTVSNATESPRPRLQVAIAAPSESTPSSRWGETTTIRRPAASAGSERDHNAPMIAALTEDIPLTCAATFPQSVRTRLRPLRAAYVDWRRRRPPDLGDLRRTTPIDPNWGFERGTPIDRVYVERFVGLARCRHPRSRPRDRRPRLHDPLRSPASRAVDILMAEEGNPEATIVGDLTDAPHIPDDTFDCAIVTQTLQFVYDVRSALATLHRVLRPGGVLLATVPGITKISPTEDAEFGEWWHYTGRSARRLAEEAFGPGTSRPDRSGTCSALRGFSTGWPPGPPARGALLPRPSLRGDRRPARKQAR